MFIKYFVTGFIALSIAATAHRVYANEATESDFSPADYTESVRAVVVRADPNALSACITLHRSQAKPIEGTIWSLYCQSTAIEIAKPSQRIDLLEPCWNTAAALVDLAPAKPEGYYFAGWCLAQKASIGGMITQLALSKKVIELYSEVENKASEKHPIVARAKMAKALFISKLPGRDDDAVIDRLMADALRAHPKLARLHVWRAQILEERGLLAEALAELEGVQAQHAEDSETPWEATMLDKPQALRLAAQWRGEQLGVKTEAAPPYVAPGEATAATKVVLESEKKTKSKVTQKKAKAKKKVSKPAKKTKPKPKR